MASPLRVGTRGSPLALWQANHIRELLARGGTETALVTIRTTGDRITDVPLSRIGNAAIFSAELDEALLAGRIDLAVHSLKDLPTVAPKGVAIVAVSERADPRDALVGRGTKPLTWSDLPQGATVASSSLRRHAQLLRARPDLQVVEIRGNVGTRLATLDATPAWSATILAVAGLERLGLTSRIGERLSSELMVPAPGQGALAVTARSNDSAVAKVARAAIHDDATALCVTAERALLRRLEGGCQVPVGALATIIAKGSLQLVGRVVSLDGRDSVESSITAPVADAAAAGALGEALADRLLAEGAERILGAVRDGEPPFEAMVP